MLERAVFCVLSGIVVAGLVALLLRIIYDFGVKGAWRIYLPRTLPQRKPLEVLSIIQIQGESLALLMNPKTKKRYFLDLVNQDEPRVVAGDVIQAFQSTSHRYEIRVTGKRTLDGVEDMVSQPSRYT